MLKFWAVVFNHNALFACVFDDYGLVCPYHDIRCRIEFVLLYFLDCFGYFFVKILIY